MTNPLGPTNFFTYYMFHPRDKTLSEADSRIAKIASAAILLLTLGAVHLVCYCFFYNRSVVQIQEKKLNLLNDTPHPTHPDIKMGINVKGEGVENVRVSLLQLSESKTNSELSQFDFNLIVNHPLAIPSHLRASYLPYLITLEGDAIEKMDHSKAFEVEILDSKGEKFKVQEGWYFPLPNNKTPTKIGVSVQLPTAFERYTFKFRYVYV